MSDNGRYLFEMKGIQFIEIKKSPDNEEFKGNNKAVLNNIKSSILLNKL